MKNRYRQLIVLTILLLNLLPLTLMAAGEQLRVRVLDKKDKKPIVGATAIVLKQGSDESLSGGVTDQNGEVSIERLSGPEYILEVSFMGYESSKTPIDSHSSQGAIEILLKDEGLVVAATVVQAKRHSQEIQERGFTLNSIDPQKSLFQTYTTQELLNRTAGVKIRQSGGVGSSVEYNINGLSGNSVKVYIDGVPISNYGRSFTVGDIPPSMIESVEIYKGVVPAHLADDALGGAIDIKLKKAGIKNLTSSYSYGSYNSHKWDLNGQYYGDNGFFVGGSAYYNYSDNNYEVWGDAVFQTNMQTGAIEYIHADRFHDSYESKGANVNFGYRNKSWADNFRVSMLFSDIKKDIQNGATMEVVYGNRRSESDSYVANLEYRKRNVVEGLDVSASASYSYTDRLLIDTTSVMYGWDGKPVVDAQGQVIHWGKGGGEGGKASLATNLENNLTTRLALAYSLDSESNHKISLNGQFLKFARDVNDPMLSVTEQALMDTRHINKFTGAFSYDSNLFDGKLKSSIFYKYFSQNLSLTDPILDNGATVEQKIDKTTDGSGYGAAFSYKVVDNLFLTLSAEKALRLAGIDELLGNSVENIMPTYDLDPEKSYNVNLGVVFGPLDFGVHSIEGGVNLFYRDVQDMIQRALTQPSDDLFGYENLGKIRSKGVDADITYTFKDRLVITAAGSYTDARFNLQYDENGGEYPYYNSRLRNMPYLTANGGASYSFDDIFMPNGRLLLNYHLNYTHEFFKNWDTFGSTGKATIPSQLSHDMGVSYVFPQDKVSVGVDAKNIFNEQLFDNYALQKPGRMIFVKLTYKFL